MTDWNGHFDDNLLSYVDQHPDSHDLLLEPSIDEYAEKLAHSESLPRLAFRVLAMEAIRREHQELVAAIEATESPIEEAMLLALVLAGRDRRHFELGEPVEVYFNFGGRVDGDGMEYITIEPQAKLGKHRVDFLVTLSSLEPLDPHLTGNVPAREDMPDPIRRSLNASDYVDCKIIVECDGHDFHDRTKEQASRDRERDRMLQSLGMPVFRYTGADIWRDVMAHAHEVIEELYRRMGRIY